MIGNTNDTSFLRKLLLINSQFGKKNQFGNHNISNVKQRVRENS